MALEEAIQAVATSVRSPRARCVIVDEGAPDESSLMGTRDGYLNLALALLRFVADADAGRCEIAAEGCFWDDRLKDVLYQLPTASPWLVGAHMFGNHADYMRELSRSIDPRLKYPLFNDPQFADPDRLEPNELRGQAQDLIAKGP